MDTLKEFDDVDFLVCGNPDGTDRYTCHMKRFDEEGHISHSQTVVDGVEIAAGGGNRAIEEFTTFLPQDGEGPSWADWTITLDSAKCEILDGNDDSFVNCEKPR